MKGTFLISKRKLSTYLGLLALATIIVFPTYADPVVKTTSGGTINVSFATDPVAPNPGDQTQLKISFINKKTNLIQPHIDYKVSVMEGNNQVFGIPITHVGEEGAVSIPVQFQDAATYQVIVEVDGILFQPIRPETATFSVSVGGVSSSQGTNQTTTGTIKIPSWVRNTAKWWHDGQVGDSDFVKGIQYLIQQGIMQILTQSQSTATGQHQIPVWIKNDAGWWASGQISDDEFVKGIQWLITNGIIVV
jgi:hypothetical protein